MVVRHVGVVVEVIAPEVGECGRSQSHTVQAMLRQPVARCFHCRVRNTLTSEFGEHTVEGDRVRGGQRTAFSTARRYDTRRADLRGLQTIRRPNLAKEADDRRLARRPRDCSDGRRLICEPLRRRL